MLTYIGVPAFIANIGVPGLIAIIALALIIFGPKRLPQFGRAAGETITEFKKSTKGLLNEEIETVKEISDQVDKVNKMTKKL